MDLYSRKSASIRQKLTVTLIELVLIAMSAWVLFGHGVEDLAPFLRDLPAGTPLRRYVIFAFNCIIFARMVFTMFYLMKREMRWSEAFTVPFAFAIYYLGFALLVLPSPAPLGIWDLVAIALFFAGCVLNTGGEVQRDRFKKDPANKGKLFTGGFFALSMHVNFFGDILWVSAYAIVTQNIWSALIVVFITVFFAAYNVPMLDRHLSERYGEQFDAYSARTKRLIPFVW